MTIKSYRDLIVWQRAMDLVEESYRLANLLPKNESYGLINQIRRAAVSIPSNIAEGHGRDHLGDYLHHLSMANGSLMEFETHLLLLPRLSYLETKEIDVAFNLADQVGKMLAALSSSLKKKNR